MPDRWAAVCPMSGGDDFVADRAIENAFNVPGFATWCRSEPGGIGADNATNNAWLLAHGYPWRSVIGAGHHAIPTPELPAIAAFFELRSREPYRDEVFVRRAGRLVHDTAPDAAASRARGWPRTEGWRGAHTWRAGRGIDTSTCHWVRLLPHGARLAGRVAPEPGAMQRLAPEPGAKQRAAPAQVVHAINRGSNVFEFRSQNVSRLRVLLHRCMVPAQRKVMTFIANGNRVHRAAFRPDLRTMLQLVREFDDRGRIYHMAVDIEIQFDAERGDPPGTPPAAAK
jgi:hypothetical protein